MKITYKDLPTVELLEGEIERVQIILKTSKCGPCIKVNKQYLSQLKSQLRDKKKEI